MHLHRLQDTAPEDLLQTWVQITQALISVGHATDLQRALNAACGSSHEDQTQDHDESIGEIQQTVMPDGRSSLVLQESLRIAANSPQSVDSSDAYVDLDQNTNICNLPTQPSLRATIEMHQETYDELMSIDNEQSIRDTVTASSPAESDTNEFGNLLGVPSDLVSDGIDLSMHRSEYSSPSFEKIFAAEVLLPIITELDENASTFLNQGIVTISMPSSPCHNPNPADQEAAGQNSYCIDILCDAESTSDIQSQQSTPVPQDLQELAKNTKHNSPIYTKTKRDLIATEISCIAQSLIQGDAINFFINNCQLIYEGWVSSLTGTASLTSTGTDESVIAAFDTLDSLRRRKDSTRLLMRSAYVQLIRAIDIHKAAARKDRFHGRERRKAGHGDTTIAIDIYLRARTNTGLSRAQLLEYIRKGTRWSRLAGQDPIILYIYSEKAETIINNNSIKLTTLDALATQARHLHPELIQVFENLSQNAELVMEPNTRHIIPHIQDTVIQFRDASLLESTFANLK